MRYSIIAVVCSLLLIGGCSTRDSGVRSRRTTTTTVDLYAGTVEMPSDFVHSRAKGIDSNVGDFTRKDGQFRIFYDIGFFAGVEADRPYDNLVSSNSITVGEHIVHVVVIGRGDTKRAIASFPDTFANFYADIQNDSQFDTLKKLVTSYRPKPKDSTK